MQYKNFKNEISLSRLGMGTMRLPTCGSSSDIDYEKAQAIIDSAMKSGINYYDTAYIYHGGRSEEFLGAALAKYPRDSFYVADKFNFQAEPDYRKQFAEQLRRLKMDRIDFYLLHGIQDSFVDDILASGAIEYFDSLKKEGKIRYFGFSFHGSPQALRKLIDAYPWDFVQMQLNYYDWYCTGAKELYDILEQANIPVMVMEPVHGRVLAGVLGYPVGAEPAAGSGHFKRHVRHGSACRQCSDSLGLAPTLGCGKRSYSQGCYAAIRRRRRCLHRLPLLLPELPEGAGYSASSARL